MCGIIGYVGYKDCSQMLLDGLSRLEYRGYDSAGIAIATSEGIKRLRAQGKLEKLRELYYQNPVHGKSGMGHTRWATHGGPVACNAHPHQAGRVLLVHNGIIENYLELKAELSSEGIEFTSETDTEIVAQLIDSALSKGASDLREAMNQALARMRGSYALLAMDTEHPEQLIAARYASPMVLGRTDDGAFVASDIPALLPYLRSFVFLEDGEMAILGRDETLIYNAKGQQVKREVTTIRWDPVSAEKQGYKHFMLKEIYEQPARIIDTLRGRARVEQGEVDLGEALNSIDFGAIEKVILLGCGTSYYASLIAKYWIEDLARLTTEVVLASEFRYSNPVVGPKTLVIPVSQSGETADTLSALEMAQKKGAQSLALCNVMASSIARKAQGVLYTHAGPEIGVASTKAFTTQLVALSLIAMTLGRQRGTLSSQTCRQLLQALREVPTLIEDLLMDTKAYANIAKIFGSATSFLFLGRYLQYPIALEGALKLKEISYIHAEGYAAGELKHGPIALIDEKMPVVVLAPQNTLYEKILSSVSEVKARQGQLIGVVTKGDQRLSELCDQVIEIPEADPYVQPILTAVVMQLLAYHIADFLGTDIDQPRNLAKSVTVE